MRSTHVQCMAAMYDWLLIAKDPSHEIKSELHEIIEQQ